MEPGLKVNSLHTRSEDLAPSFKAGGICSGRTCGRVGPSRPSFWDGSPMAPGMAVRPTVTRRLFWGFCRGGWEGVGIWFQVMLQLASSTQVVGGLSVLKEIRLQMPTESVLYFADQAHVPYGHADWMKCEWFSEQITRFYSDWGRSWLLCL